MSRFSFFLMGFFSGWRDGFFLFRNFKRAHGRIYVFLEGEERNNFSLFDTSKQNLNGFIFFLRERADLLFFWQFKTEHGWYFLLLDGYGWIKFFLGWERRIFYFDSSKGRMSEFNFFFWGEGEVLGFVGRPKQHVERFTFFLRRRDGFTFFFTVQNRI